MCVQNFIKLSPVDHELSTVHWILDNCRLWSNIIYWTDQSIDKRKTALWTTIFSLISENYLENFGPLAKKWPWRPMTLKFNRVLDVVEVHVHAKFYQVECSGSWVNRVWCCDLELWLMTLKFSGFRVVVKEPVHAKFHRAKCSSWWVILHTVETRKPS